MLFISVYVILMTLAGTSTSVESTRCKHSYFPCGNTSLCLHQSLQCNQIQDCPDGEDEDFEECNSNSGLIRELYRYVSSSNNDSEEATGYQNNENNKTCFLKNVPECCICEVYTLNCSQQNLTSVPGNLPNNTRQLYLTGNKLKEIVPYSLSNLVHLKTLLLKNNSLHSLDGVLTGMRSLTVLGLEGNKLTSLPAEISQVSSLRYLFLSHNVHLKLSRGIFDGLHELTKLVYDKNDISNLPGGVFTRMDNLRFLTIENGISSGENQSMVLRNGTITNLPSLEMLFLGGNNLEEIQENAITNTPNLINIQIPQNRLSPECDEVIHLPSSVKWLLMEENLLTCVTRATFSELPLLRILHLSDNRIEIIAQNAFSHLKHLSELELGRNRIHMIYESAFPKSIEVLSFEQNPIGHIPSNMFNRLVSMECLNLFGISISNINTEMFRPLVNLLEVKFSQFQYCQYAPHVKNCSPKGDGVSSLQNLLDSLHVKFAIWFFAMATISCNSAVIIGRFIQKTKENEVTSIVIVNLACADCLMGFHLAAIGFVDWFYRDDFILHAHGWMTSRKCLATGILGVVSSEVSLLILLYMSFERFFKIVFPFILFERSAVKAKQAMVLIWITGIVLSLMPLVSSEVFGEFYGQSMLCFPLHLHVPSLSGSGYAAFLFLGINPVIIVLISFCYISMFINIIKTRSASGRLDRKSDKKCALRFFFVVFTDLLCWVPIIVIKTVVLLKVPLPSQMYAWITAVMLPINSSINPILYSLCAYDFRKGVIIKLGRWRQKNVANMSPLIIRNSPCMRFAALNKVFMHRKSVSDTLRNTYERTVEEKQRLSTSKL